MHRLAGKAFDNQKGITGIEIVIVPLAFVVADVAITCVAFSAGLFSTRKTKATIHFRLD